MAGKYKRILLKISGEMLQGGQGFGIDPKTVATVASQIAAVRADGVEVALVIGGGNIFRGMHAAEQGMERVTADHIGMLATVINALAVQDALEKLNIPTRVMTAVEMKSFAEQYIRRRAVRHLEKGRVVIFGGGTGNPYFTTDTTAALRAVEVSAEVILKATKVDGVYDKDPVKHPDAVKFESLHYIDVLKKQLKVMDATAVSLCMDNKLPIIVFDVTTEGNIKKVVNREAIGTIVS